MTEVGEIGGGSGEHVGVEETPKDLERKLPSSKELLNRPQVLQEAMYLLLEAKPDTIFESLITVRAELEKLTLGREAVASPQSQEKIQEAKENHKSLYKSWLTSALEKQKERTNLNLEIEQLENLVAIHCSNFFPSIHEGKPTILSSFYATSGERFFPSVHFSINHSAKEMRALSDKEQTWRDSRCIVLVRLKDLIETNGAPTAFLPEDCWWGIGINPGVVLPKETRILVKRGEQIEGLQELRSAGLQVFEVENTPYDAVSEQLKAMGSREIKPDEFKNPDRFAVEIGTFYGHSDPFLSDESGEYIRSLAVLGESWDDLNAREAVEHLNKTVKEYGADDLRYASLVQLTKRGYFEANGFMGVHFDLMHLPDDLRQNIFFFLEDKKDAEKWLELDSRVSKEGLNGLRKFKEDLQAIARDRSLKFPLYSEGYLAFRLGEIKERLKMISPETLGIFLIMHPELLETESIIRARKAIPKAIKEPV